MTATFLRETPFKIPRCILPFPPAVFEQPRKQMTESPTHRVLAKLHKLPQNKNKPLIKNHLHYWKADYTSFHLISQSASGNIKAKCQANTFPLLPQADLSVVMAFPICSQLLCSLFWLTSVTETRLISLLKIHRGRISAWREILGCDPGDGMDV